MRRVGEVDSDEPVPDPNAIPTHGPNLQGSKPPETPGRFGWGRVRDPRARRSDTLAIASGIRAIRSDVVSGNDPPSSTSSGSRAGHVTTHGNRPIDEGETPVLQDRVATYDFKLRRHDSLSNDSCSRGARARHGPTNRSGEVRWPRPRVARRRPSRASIAHQGIATPPLARQICPVAKREASEAR
jgi:hypothetical protein